MRVLLRITLRQAIARFSPGQRAVTVLRCYEDLTTEETADLLDCSTGTVKSQTHRAISRLRELVPDLADLA